MRDYSKVSPRFWTGDTGRQIRELGRDAQVIAFYLFTCPSANMLGLYYLNLPTLCHETGSPLEGALEALRSLENIGFAHYDPISEHVYLPNMAREQVGERLKDKDNRHVSVLRELESLRKTPFFNSFVERYRDAYRLHDVQLNKPLPSPSGGTPKGLPRGSKDPSTPLRSQEQEQEHEHEQEQDVYDAEGEKPRVSESLTDAEHHERFERLKAIYPAFSGKPGWIQAELACRRHIELGRATWDELHAGVERFAAFVKAKGRSGPQYVETPANFFNDEELLWRLDWAPPLSKDDQRIEDNIDETQAWLAERRAKNAQ